ncbi:2390_t:CDS:1, partial [Funneliformis geosporum]
ATKSVLRKKEDFTNEHESYETYYLVFLVHLLKTTDIYGIEALKDKVEDTIIRSHINVHNVCEILEWSKQSKAPQLINHCEQFIESNEKIILEQKLEYLNGEDEDEISEENEMINTLLEI